MFKAALTEKKLRKISFYIQSMWVAGSFSPFFPVYNVNLLACINWDHTTTACRIKYSVSQKQNRTEKTSVRQTPTHTYTRANNNGNLENKRHTFLLHVIFIVSASNRYLYTYIGSYVPMHVQYNCVFVHLYVYELRWWLARMVVYDCL